MSEFVSFLNILNGKSGSESGDHEQQISGDQEITYVSSRVMKKQGGHE